MPLLYWTVLEAMLLGVVTEGPVGNLEQLGRSGADSSRLFEGGLQIAALRCRNNLLKVDAFRREFHSLAGAEPRFSSAIAQDPLGQPPRRDLSASFQSHRALHCVF